MKISASLLALALVIASCSETSSVKDKSSEGLTNNEELAYSDESESSDSGAFASPDFRKLLVSSAPADDVTLISDKAGIFIGPDSIQIEQMKSELGEEDFYTVADDNNYYESEARDFLEQKNIKVVYPKTQYLKFKTATGKEYTFDTKSKASRGWLTVLFNPKKESPIIVSLADIDLEFESYFTDK